MANNHSGRGHAFLSASGSSRWINCTPSPMLEKKFASKPSSYAEEGTLAHEFGDAFLSHFIGKIDLETFNGITLELRKNKYYSNDMLSHVEKYTDYVLESLSTAKSETPGAALLVEERFDFSDYVEGGFGTGDSTVVGDGVLEVIDLKYGKGVAVYADNNSQLMLYGLGALNHLHLMYDIHTVKLTIVQPRMDNVSSWTISVSDLVDWGNETAKPASEKAYRGEGEQKTGPWCRWCKAKAKCAALSSKHLQLARQVFKEPKLIEDSELLEIYSRSKDIKLWLDSINRYVYDEAISGKSWPGYKLAKGKSRRTWSDADSAIDKLTELGFSVEQVTNTKIKGILDIAQLMSLDNFNENFESFISMKESKPVLVPEDSDKQDFDRVGEAKKVFTKQ